MSKIISTKKEKKKKRQEKREKKGRTTFNRLLTLPAGHSVLACFAETFLIVAEFSPQYPL